MDNFSDIFITIKPLFDAVIRNPTKETIIKLNEQLQRVDEHSVNILQNIFLQQLVIIVDTVPGENQNELKTHLLECMITILQKGRLKKEVALKTTLLVAVKLIYDKDSGTLRSNLSEEYKLAVLKVISLVTRRVQSELVEELYVKANLTLLSQAIFVCVRVVDTERARKLRFQAVDSILSLLQVHDDFDSNDIVLRCQVAELLFITLPKLLATYVSIINGDEKQGTAVYRIALKALGRTLGLIFEDYSKEATHAEYTVERFVELTESMTGNGRNVNVLGLGLKKDAKIKYFNETERSREWLLQAEKKVEQILQLIQHYRAHEEESVRLEFAKMNCALLENCTYNMPSCTIHYLQSVIAMCYDESMRVRDVCKKCSTSVADFTISFAGTRMDELFYNALNQLPRIIYRGEEREQIASFRLITGFLNFFSESQLSNVLSGQHILEQFIKVLLAGAELESVDELIRREYVSYRFEYVEGFRVQKEKNESRWIVFQNVRSPRAKQAFLELVHSLRAHDQAVNTVLMYILDDFYASRINSNGYVLILSELIPTAHTVYGTDSFKPLLVELLQPHHWFLELDDNDNIIDQKYNALHICLVVRAISKLAQWMEEHFRWYLYDTLRILLQCSGSTINCINESAELALDIVANALGLSSIGQLIHHNLDYISQQVTRCLRRAEHFRDGMCILESVLRFVPYESSDVLESTVTPIVMNILDSYSQYGATNSIICLRVLQIFIHSIRLRYQHDSVAAIESTEDKAIKTLTEQIERLQNLLQREVANETDDPTEPDVLPEPDEDLHPGETEEDKNDEEEETTEKEENLPAHIKIVLRILTVNFKYLASSNDAEKIVSLSTLNEGIHLLHLHENQLLPLVHNIWFNFTERFTDRNPAVLSNAFDLLLTLARLAKDFILKRTLDDVLPKLYKFMMDHCSADVGEHQVHKLQCKFLTSIDELVRNLNFSEKQMDEALDIIRLYREKCERRELKKRAAECMQRMRSINSFAVFLKCDCRVVQ